MRAIVRTGFPTFSGRLEGVVPWFYLDILGLVTVAIGNLVDPLAYALGLPFLRKDGTPATPDEIAAAWNVVKKNPNAAKFGHRYAEGLTSIRLTPEGVARVVTAKLEANEKILVQRFPEFEEWPADAQLATHSMAWACGAGFRFPALASALVDRDFEAAVRHCHINTDGPDRIPNTADDNWGVKPRNVANKTMYANAAKVQGYKLDPDSLLYEIPGLAVSIPPEVHVATPPPAEHVQAPQEAVLVDWAIVHAMPEFPPRKLDFGDV